MKVSKRQLRRIIREQVAVPNNGGAPPAPVSTEGGGLLIPFAFAANCAAAAALSSAS